MPSLTNPPQDGGQRNPTTGLMFLQPDTIALPVFATVMAIAAYEDFRRLVIPNLLPVILCAAWPVHFAAAPSLFGAATAIGCALAVFLVGAVLYSRDFLGGGDVKLLSAATLWAGASGTPSLLMLTGILGGGIALLLLMPGAAQIVSMVRSVVTRSPIETEHVLKMRMPYGLAIIGAALIVVLSPYLG